MSTCVQYSIHSICRICLEQLKHENSYDLFAIPGLAKKLCMCTSLTVEPQDGFPRNVCGICYTRLNDMHQFQKQCVDSVQKFQEMLASNIFISDENALSGLETGGLEEQNIGADDDEPVNYDPLLNHKLELLDNAEDVFKMLENVEREAEESEKAELAELAAAKKQELKPEATQNVEPKSLYSDDSSSDSDYFNDDTDFVPPQENDNASSDSDDDKPLALRLRKNRSSRSKEDEAEGEDNESKSNKKAKVKRKRITIAERRPPIECHICHQRFKKVERYEDHMKYHNDKLPHQCTVETCLKGFTTANGLRLHMEHCHAETLTSFACPQEGCGRTFPRTRLLNWHLKKVHKIVKELSERKCFPCNECDKVFRCPMALKKHMYKHDGKELPFPCNICGKRFVINSALRDHLMRHAGIKNYVCPYCGVGKTTRQEWNTHINTHTQEKKFKCTQCDHASHNKQNLRMHVKIVHEKIKDYACQYCGKTFGKSNACKMHEMTHTGEKRCECKVCGKRFLYAKGLTKHLKTHEKRVIRAIEVYRKRQIAKGFMSPDQPPPVIPDLPIPIRNSQDSHQKVADEILKVCAESTATIPKNPRLVERVDISELAGTAVNPISSVAVPSWSPQINFMMKEGPHICPDCGQGFNGQGNLKRHHRIVHEGVKDFACRYCHKRFAKAQTLKHHEMTHTGEKPHECKTCGKRFIQYVALKRHYKVHMSKPPPVIPSSVYEAREELQLQERAKLEAKRKAQEERDEIAEKAKMQLHEMEQQELLTLPEGDEFMNITDDKSAVTTTAITDADAEKDDEKSSSLGDFAHVNTSSMGTRTVDNTNNV